MNLLCWAGRADEGGEETKSKCQLFQLDLPPSTLQELPLRLGRQRKRDIDIDSPY